jgi:hypothetical protein
LTLGHTSTEADVQAVVDAIGPVVERARRAGVAAGLDSTAPAGLGSGSPAGLGSGSPAGLDSTASAGLGGGSGDIAATGVASATELASQPIRDRP